jgi:serine/threonine protein kinase
LCDFGLARRCEICGGHYTKSVITLSYRPPELLLGGKDYSFSADIWSLGVVFAEMILGKTPFRGDSETDVLHKIFPVVGTPNERVWPGCSKLPSMQSEAWRACRRVNFRQYFHAADPEFADVIDAML